MPILYTRHALSQRRSSTRVMGLAETHTSSKYFYKSDSGLIMFNSSSSGGLVSSGNLRDIYTNGFLETLRQNQQSRTPIMRVRSACRTKREKEDFYMKTQCFSNWKQQQAESTYRQYQVNRVKALSKPKRVTKKYITCKLSKRYLN